LKLDLPMPNIAYDKANIFARILRGELPAHKVYEDENVLAFLDIMPRADGHILVIPKVAARTILDVDPASLSTLIAAVQKLARAVKTAMAADGITIQQFNEPAGGQVVFHLHFHVIPRFEGVKMRPHTGEMASSDALKAQATRIRAVLQEG
jgi:histidine triad (HIT) family protein